MLPAGWTFWLTMPDTVFFRLWSRRLTARLAPCFDTNLFAPLAVLRAALPSLRQNRGRVLQLSSMLGEVAWLGSGVYSARKAAIELVMEGLAHLCHGCSFLVSTTARVAEARLKRTAEPQDQG
jgi:NAD(P)-dependent dehydrogenase (short-subunit alcohol dehydrogenase family)